MPTVPPSAKPDRGDGHLQRSSYRADPDSRATSAHEHQRVARPGAHGRADVEPRAEPDEEDRRDEQRDADAERLLGERLERA